MGGVCSTTGGEITPDNSTRGGRKHHENNNGDQTSVGSTSLPIKAEDDLRADGMAQKGIRNSPNSKHQGGGKASTRAGGSTSGMHSPHTGPTIDSSTGMMDTEGHFSFNSNSRILPPLLSQPSGNPVPLAAQGNQSKAHLLFATSGTTTNPYHASGSNHTSYYYNSVNNIQHITNKQSMANSNHNGNFSASATKYRGGGGGGGFNSSAAGLGNQSATVGKGRGRGGVGIVGGNSSSHSISGKPSGYSSVLNKPKPGELLKMSVTQAQEYGMGSSKTVNGAGNTIGGGAGGRGGRRVVATRTVIRGATLVPGPLLFDEHTHAASMTSTSGENNTNDNSLSNMSNNNVGALIGRISSSTVVLGSTNNNEASSNPSSRQITSSEQGGPVPNQDPSLKSTGSPLFPADSTKVGGSEVPSDPSSPTLKPSASGGIPPVTANHISVCNTRNNPMVHQSNTEGEPMLKRTLFKHRRNTIDDGDDRSTSSDDDELELLQESFCSSTQLVSHDMTLGNATPGAGGSILGRSQRRKSHRQPTPQQASSGAALNHSGRYGSRSGAAPLIGRVGNAATPPLSGDNNTSIAETSTYSITKPDFLTDEPLLSPPPADNLCGNGTNSNPKHSSSNNNSIVIIGIGNIGAANDSTHDSAAWKVMGANAANAGVAPAAEQNIGKNNQPLGNNSITSINNNNNNNNNVFFLGSNSSVSDAHDAAVAHNRGSDHRTGSGVVFSDNLAQSGNADGMGNARPLSRNNGSNSVFNSSNPDGVMVIGRQARRQRGASTTGLSSSIGLIGGYEQQPASSLQSPNSNTAAAPQATFSSSPSTVSPPSSVNKTATASGEIRVSQQHPSNALALSNNGSRHPSQILNGTGVVSNGAAIQGKENLIVRSPPSHEEITGRSFASSLIREPPTNKAILHPNVVENEMAAGSVVSVESAK